MFKKAIVFIALILFSCRTKMYKEAMHVVKGMTLEQKIGQMLMLGVPGKHITKDAVAIIEDHYPGGIILFGFNLGNTDELKKFIEDLQDTAFEKYNIPLFISIDQEGGRVKRIKSGVAQFPGNMALGVIDDVSMTYETARILGMELRKLGVNMNLAPVLDVNNNPSNPVINTRSFGSDASIVSRQGGAYIRGLQKSGCIAVGKHFPGHGDTDKDSHFMLPVINYDLQRLRKIEFPPFIKAIKSDVEAIMTAHISFPNIINNNLPVTVSKQFLGSILRQDMGFEGIIITDDMEMNAISKTIDLEEASVMSVNAGADIILISSYGKKIDIITTALKQAVSDGRITEERIDESVVRIIEVKLRYNIMSYTQERIGYAKFYYDEDELEILKKAEVLNKKLSRDAIYFYSNTQYPPMNDNSHPKIFISSNDSFINGIKAFFSQKDYKLFTEERDFLKFIRGNIHTNADSTELKNSSIYYQFDNKKPELIDELIHAARDSGMRLYLLCTGNPFPLKNIKDLPPAFFTFSNTEESVKQLILCLKGEFRPKEKINISLGFN